MHRWQLRDGLVVRVKKNARMLDTCMSHFDKDFTARMFPSIVTKADTRHGQCFLTNLKTGKLNGWWYAHQLVSMNLCIESIAGLKHVLEQVEKQREMIARTYALVIKTAKEQQRG